jgi:hypothetical protein
MILGCKSCSRHHSLCDCPASVRQVRKRIDAILSDPPPAPTGHPVDVDGWAIRDAAATIDTYAEQTRMRILRAICDPDRWPELVALARTRATSIGAQQYGNASYHKPIAELDYEGACEIADLIFYWSVIEEQIAERIQS